MFRPFTDAAPRPVSGSSSRYKPVSCFAAFFLLLSLLIPLTPQFSPTIAAQTGAPDAATAAQSAVASAVGVDPSVVIVAIIDANDDWAFGTATVPAGESDSPAVKFFLAHHDAQGGWEAVLRFTDAFDALLAQAPETFPAEPHRSLLLPGVSLAAVDDSQLSFPFPAGETWGFLGPHEGTPWRALDFTAGDGSVNDPIGTVTAMRGGTVYRPCSGMVMVDHGDGWTTGYYHVDPVIVTDGQMVARGQAIGSTSKNYDCGGYAASNHVHVWTEYRGQSVAIAGQVIGGWTVENGPGDYYGCLVKGNDRRCRQPNGIWNNQVTNTSDVGSGGTGELLVAPAGGLVGETLDYTLTAFPANTSVALSWKRPGGSVVSLGSAMTNGSGQASGQITIPATTIGDLNRMQATAGAQVRSSRIAVYPNVTVQPAAVQPGTQVTVTVSGFPKQTPVTIMASDGVEPGKTLGMITTNNTGGGTLKATFPNGLPNGFGLIEAIGPGEATAATDIEISGSTPVGPPTASVTPARNTVNNWVTLSVTNFPPMAPVQVKWIRTSGGSIDVANLLTDATGAATGQIRVPATPGGVNTVRFIAGAITVNVPFEVAPRIKVIPGTTEPGATVDVSLRGFGKKETVRIRWKQGNSWVELATVLTSNTGSANVMVKVPNWVPSGTNSVRGDGPLFRAQTNAVNVDGGALLQIAEEVTPTPEPTETETPVEETPVVEEPVATPEPGETPEPDVTPTPDETETPVDPEPTPAPGDDPTESVNQDG